jgi:hypothetical protein
VVAAACDALRVLTLATWRPPKGVPLKRPTLKDFVLDLHLGAAPSKEGRKAVRMKERACMDDFTRKRYPFLSLHLHMYIVCFLSSFLSCLKKKMQYLCFS